MSEAGGLLDYLLDQLAGLGGIHWRFMFGGVGLYRDGVMFGIVVDDVLYLKADDLSRTAFEERELEPFTYTRQGRVVALSYYRAPDEILDDPEALQAWVHQACNAAHRSRR